MSHFEVFNGDADGLCALQQLRLARPAPHAAAATCVTGVKRDIRLLERVLGAARPDDSVTVLDIALEVNRAALEPLLERGVRVEWFDHHHPGPIPRHPLLTTRIDPREGVCTALLVDVHLGGRQGAWAAVGACGDNLLAEGRARMLELGLNAAERAELELLGICLNYNAYGDTLADLVIDPAALAALLHPCAHPLDFVRDQPVCRAIRAARAADLDQCASVQPSHVLVGGRMVVLPDAPWSRRMRGDLANQWANARPDLATAVLTPNARGGYVVSVRAPLNRRHGADRLCRQFESGSGRPAAAGINHLDPAQIDSFAEAFDRAFRNS